MPGLPELLAKNVWDMSDEELLSLWENIVEVEKVSGPEFVEKLLTVTTDMGGRITFNADSFSPEEKAIFIAAMDTNVRDGILFKDAMAREFVKGERTAVLKARQFFRLQNFNSLISSKNAFGYIRFNSPEFLSMDQINQRNLEHLMKPEEIETLWPDATGLYFYPLRDFIPFDKPREIAPIEGEQVFVDNVEIKKSDDSEKRRFTIEYTTEIVKRSSDDDDEHYILGEVMIPNEEDTEGDITTRAEICKAQRKYMLYSQETGVDHKSKNPNIRVVENFIAPVDMTIGEKIVTAGTWLMGVLVLDEEVWGEVKEGNLTGFSPHGDAWAQQV